MGFKGQIIANFDVQYSDAIQRLLDQYQRLNAFAENLGVVKQLRSLGVQTGILSNGDADMLAAVVHSAGFDGLLDHILTVDSVRKFKTHPKAYAIGEQALGLDAKEIVFVSSNAWDALGATWYGYQTLWVNRYGLPFEELGCQPSRTGADLQAVLDFFPN
jgi:2-haloacid dehalogenase